jgi:Ino eighty subunit 2
MDTINKLLKKQAPKRRGKIAAAETAGDTTPRIQEAQESEKPEPTMIRYISNRNGCKIGVPEEWLGTPAGRLFGSTSGKVTKTHIRRLVEEI